MDSAGFGIDILQLTNSSSSGAATYTGGAAAVEENSTTGNVAVRTT